MIQQQHTTPRIRLFYVGFAMLGKPCAQLTGNVKDTNT